MPHIDINKKCKNLIIDAIEDECKKLFDEAYKIDMILRRFMRGLDGMVNYYGDAVKNNPEFVKQVELYEKRKGELLPKMHEINDKLKKHYREYQLSNYKTYTI